MEGEYRQRREGDRKRRYGDRKRREGDGKWDVDIGNGR